MSPWQRIDPDEHSMYTQRLLARTSGVTAAVALPTILVFGLLLGALAGVVALALAYTYYYAKIGREIEASLDPRAR